VGYNEGGDVLASFWDTQTSGQSDSDGGTGKTTAELQTVSTFISWGCGSVWTIDEGKDYPRLWWENMPGEVINIPSELYGGGSGEPNDPYLIYTAEQLNTIGLIPCDLDQHFILMNAIDLSTYTGTWFNIIGISHWLLFTGVFDGRGHTISNFTYTSTGTGLIGLFGYVSGEIKNLGLIYPNLDAGTGGRVGSLVGGLWEGTISNCYVEGGSVSGSRDIGGLVGGNWEGTISNCYSTGSVSGSSGVGGLVAENYSGTITNCYATGSVSSSGSAGGLVGYNYNVGTITDCSSSGSVSGNYRVGGLVGGNGSAGTITNSYSAGSVSGDDYVGGLVGYNDEGTITNCYSAGTVSGDFFVGGLVGYNEDSTITNCYSAGTVSGDWSVGGLVGKNEEGEVTDSFWDTQTSGQTTSAGGTGKTTAEMQTASTFVCWGYEPVWTVNESVDYPRLWWENKPGELITVPSGLYEGGSGDPNDPYLIYTAEQLNTIGLIPCDWDRHFLLCADIDLSDFTGTSFNIIGYYASYRDNRAFTGVFDGNGHTISNFNYSSTDKNNVGLFGYVDDPNAEIKNLSLFAPDVDVGIDNYYIGSLVGRLTGGTITKCYVEVGRIAGSSMSWPPHSCVGGLVGHNSGKIINCRSQASVSGAERVGGLVGYNNGMRMEQSPTPIQKATLREILVSADWRESMSAQSPRAIRRAVFRVIGTSAGWWERMGGGVAWAQSPTPIQPAVLRAITTSVDW
jgi:hypothetical protein